MNASGTRLTKKTDTLPLHGHGRPVNPCGMTWSGFRPSDDCCTFGYLIPSNMMAVVALGYAAEIAERVYNDSALADECRILKEDIEDAVEVYGVVNHPKYGRIYADIAVKNKAEIFCCHAYIAQAMYIGKLRTADLTE